MEEVLKLLSPFFSMIEDPAIFELGAHRGTSTEEIIKHFDSPTYWAFEPDPRNVAVLRRNPLFQGRVMLRDVAVSDRMVADFGEDVLFENREFKT